MNIMCCFIMFRGVYEVWASGATIEECIENGKLCATDPTKELFFQKGITFCGRVRAYGKKFQSSEKLPLITRFLGALPFQAKVDLDNPDYEFWIMLDYGAAENKPDQPLKRVFFTRKLVKSSREPLLLQYALNAREYIGTTSTKAELAFIMANQALVQPGDLVYDPFVGTASIIISCAVFGATVFGSDIDIRVIKGNEKTLFDSFKQYKLPRPEIIRSDASRPIWRSGMTFDAIVCDPPYGIREGPRKSGTKKEIKEIAPEHLDSHIPRTQVYDPVMLMNDLLNFAAKNLKLGGRLVFLFPANEEYSEEDLPKHPCLRLVANCEQYLSRKLSRRLITLEKNYEHQDGLSTSTPDEAPSHARMKDHFFMKSEDPSRFKKPKNSAANGGDEYKEELR
eukprot:TRINITY_DN46631_c0_g1_i2.p2 TRINITY_DN46631_c0_g1~~TRINITY_DN46631_c0_g1_i2.p2  ORF type:complete len:395 (-),score=116.58 TRINITY_DN46631_c0_g1_i2:1665-2849(-)